MHIEVLVEDSSGAELLKFLLPKIIGAHGAPHTWRLHACRGIGRLPNGLRPRGDPGKKTLLNKLPAILQAHGKTHGIDATVVVLDADDRDCRAFLRELNMVAENCVPVPHTLFRLAIEEIEAWYFGDRNALLTAYPKARTGALERYRQDSVCETWERLADAIYPGGAAVIKKAGWPLPGQLKHDWAKRIGPLLNIDENQSPSFCKLRDGLRRLLS